MGVIHGESHIAQRICIQTNRVRLKPSSWDSIWNTQKSLREDSQEASEWNTSKSIEIGSTDTLSDDVQRKNKVSEVKLTDGDERV